MLDLGANVQCDAENLVDFAVMGNAFARSVLGLREPTYALLNVGSEEIKGHESLQEASAVLRSSNLPGKFLGFVEGDDIGKGTADVIVTDGRSEEHTSELQSLMRISYAVFCLKKKQAQLTHHT